MTTLAFIFIAVVCIGAISMTIHGNSKINSKSIIPYTDDSYLYDRQELIEAMSAPSSPVSEKPKSNLRGVQNKRFRKK